MEVDNDVEAQLLQQFSLLGTTDKEVLVLEFQKLIGNNPNPSMCAFFLDMNNWNLPAAIGAYYDYEQPCHNKVPLMSFVKDITIGEGESVPPNTNFIKTWRIKNTGDECWPPGCCLRFLQGERMGNCDRVMVEVLQPNSFADVGVEMRSPGSTGIFQGQWRMQTSTGIFFGELIWVILQVEDSGLLGVTQQFSNIPSSYSNDQVQSRHLENPFGSPTKTSSAENPFSKFEQLNTDSVFGSSAMGDSAFLSSESQSHLSAQNQFGSPTKYGTLGETENFAAQLPEYHVSSEQLLAMQPPPSVLSLPTEAVASGLSYTLPSSWPGSPTMSLAHDITAPTPNVSPNNNPASVDILDEMT